MSGIFINKFILKFRIFVYFFVTYGAELRYFFPFFGRRRLRLPNRLLAEKKAGNQLVFPSQQTRNLLIYFLPLYFIFLNQEVCMIVWFATLRMNVLTRGLGQSRSPRHSQIYENHNRFLQYHTRFVLPSQASFCFLRTCESSFLSCCTLEKLLVPVLYREKL